jgi:hypothetical protein
MSMKEKVSVCRWLVPVLAMLLMSTAGSARASTLYTNLNPNPVNTYNCCALWTIEGTSTGAYFAQGFSFTPSTTEGLSQIDIALQLFTGTDSMIVTLNANSGGLPGSILETWNVSGLAGPGSCCALQSLAPAIPITLSSASVYWLVATPGAANTSGG